MSLDTKDFAHRYGPWAFIAGGSEGIGKSFAEQLAAQGINLMLVSRRAEPLAEAAADLQKKYGVQVETHALDLTGPDLEARLDPLLAGKAFGLLIYNAGATHGAGLFLDQPVDKALNLVRLNCVGPTVLAHKFGNRMKQRGRGGIILMSSMAAFAGGGYIAAYSATKSFDIILAESLWLELGSVGVDVLGLIAGATLTPAMMRSGMKFGAPGSATPATAGSGQPNVEPMAPDDVAREALEHLGQGPIWIAGEKNRAVEAGMRSAPRPILIEAMTNAAAQLYEKPVPKHFRR